MEMSTFSGAVVAVGLIVAVWKTCGGKSDSDKGLAKGRAQGDTGSASGSAAKQELSRAQVKKILSKPHLSAAATKKLAAACADVRDVKRRLVENDDLAERIDFATQLEPAIKDLNAKASALDLITGRHGKLCEYGFRQTGVLHDIANLLDQARTARRHYAKGLATLQADDEKLRKRAADVPDPPVRKKFEERYGSDEAVDTAVAEFDALVTDLDAKLDELLENSQLAVNYFRTPAFDEMRQAIDALARMDKRMQLESKVHVKKAKPDKEEVADDPEPPRLPQRPADRTTGLTFRVTNPGFDSDDELTDAAQRKVDAFDHLDGTVLTARLRDLMNDHFGNYEVVNHHTIRLSRRHRLEFDVVVTATEVQATIVRIGDPSYEH